MILKIISVCLASIAISLAGSHSASAQDVDDLFANHNVVDVTITAPFEQIMLDRPEDEYVPAKFDYVAADGTAHSLDIGIRTRGKFRRRRDICPFAPLRVNYRKKQLDGTSFDKQDKLKLVTHCRNGSKQYDQTVVAEYLAYRILNVLTDVSFRVRLMRVKYVYADDDNDTVEAYAFFIEHKEGLEKRLQLPAKEIRKISTRELQPEHGNLVSVFHYLIGNTDFSPVLGPPGEFCCHNHELFGNEEPPYWSIPYDFDQSGFVNARHASPNPRFKLRSVRQRLYRGRCVNNMHLPDTLELYQAKRSEIETLINDQPELTDRTRKHMLSFVGDFYETISDPKKVDRQMIKACI
ncbi:MAG: hypothetical protein ACR2QT_08465 [Woeseiaceae bacterium]